MAQRYNMALTCTRADVDAFVVNKLGLKLGTGITGPEEDLLKNFLWKHGYRFNRTVLKKKFEVEQTGGSDKANDVRRFCIDKGLGMYHVTSAQDPGFIQHVIAVHVQRDKCEYFEDGAWHPLDKLTYFRFTKQQIVELVRFLCFPDEIITTHRYKADPLEAICIMLNRLALPHRLDTMVETIGRSREALSAISNHVMMHVYDCFHHLLELDEARLDAGWM
ncbi:hypothetical protein SDRG_08700 [Saprolegnia diclina VS20]|uniref:Uncharacterized protein n=1 Tax=Saprolegnia diclina (strain VS20) TaxID=1156394 RepID=T0RMN7_SAPDV|nr:hypothetical protein SDRG_08700 [Saprolegnia diclina VS20]EQC33593.1 hypothetical protein SDRG_08700 [Saprolegnia diclina VS20]|eukprot:XP_008612816.1 hypothetical protein SDRG_08700 [Saprolegnia diclina VS20]